MDTLGALVNGLAGGPLLLDFAVTIKRTLEAFAIAAVIGVPVGVLLGSNERAYRSVEFLIDFFRSTPSSALIPLFYLLIFGVSDVNKIAIAAFGALLIVLFNSAYGVMNARKQRIMAAKVMGASRWQIFKDVLIWESLQPTFVGLRSAVSMALVIVIVAEMFIGSDNGLGHRIIDAQQVLNVKSMYSAILAAGILGFALNVLVFSCSSGGSSTGAEDSHAPVERSRHRRRPGSSLCSGSRQERTSPSAASPMYSLPGWPLYENFDLNIPKHKIVSVFGPNGCGKSTLINMIAGLIPIDAGEILFDGKSLAETKIGYVFQNYRDALFPWMRTIDNIAYPLKLEGKSKPEVDARLAELVASFDVKFDLKRFPYELSGGQASRRRVDHACSGAKTGGAVSRRAFLGARFRDDPVHSRKAAGSVHADGDDHDARFPRPRREAVVSR